MTEPLPPEHDADRPFPRNQGPDEDRHSNVLLLVFFAVIVGIGIWLLNAMMDARKADECMSQGRRDCTPINVPSR